MKRIQTTEFRDAFLAGTVNELRKKYGVDRFEIDDLNLSSYNGENLDGLKGISVGGNLYLNSFTDDLDGLVGITIGGNLNLQSYNRDNLKGLKGVLVVIQIQVVILVIIQMD